MTTTRARWCVVLMALMMGPVCGFGQRQYPEYGRIVRVFSREWETASVVFVGDVVRIRPYGTQRGARLLPPASAHPVTLYWCEGDVRVDAVLKGRAPERGKKVLFAAVFPGCPLSTLQRRMTRTLLTRVWFMTEEQEFLRFVNEAGSICYFGLRHTWNARSELPPAEQFVTLLLTPNVKTEKVSEFGNVVWTYADFGCSILGEAKCVALIRNLVQLGDATLTTNVCQYLQAQHNEPCLP